MYRSWAYLALVLIIAELFAGCGGGSGSSSPPPPAPTVTLNASPNTVNAGQGVTLSWTSTNATSVASSNFNASAVNSAVTLFPSTTTSYTLTVSGKGGKATATAPVTIEVVPPPSAVSGFGTTAYTPGTGFPVQITVTPNPTTTPQCYAVEDIPPAGWTVTNIATNIPSDTNMAFDSVNNTVKWGPFTDAQPRVLYYTAIPPATAGGIVMFSGTASFNGSSNNIIGDRSLDNRSRAGR